MRLSDLEMIDREEDPALYFDAFNIPLVSENRGS